MDDQDTVVYIQQLTERSAQKLTVLDEAHALLRSFIALPTNEHRRKLDAFLTKYQDDVIEQCTK